MFQFANVFPDPEIVAALSRKSRINLRDLMVS